MACVRDNKVLVTLVFRTDWGCAHMAYSGVEGYPVFKWRCENKICWLMSSQCGTIVLFVACSLWVCHTRTSQQYVTHVMSV
jgi:hypothetical protein